MKTDSSDHAAKMALRLHFLRRYHSDGGARVFDCCQGGGHIWREIRRLHPVSHYWGVDRKPRRGRLKIDAERIVERPGLQADVVDIDTYGRPWRLWLALVKVIARPTTVYLTIGRNVRGTPPILSSHELDALGLLRLPSLPKAFHAQLTEIAVSACLTMCCDYGTMIVEATEAVSRNRNMRYIGVRLVPRQHEG